MLAAQNGNTRTCVSLLGSDTYTAVNNVSKVSNNITFTSVCVGHGMMDRE